MHEGKNILLMHSASGCKVLLYEKLSSGKLGVTSTLKVESLDSTGRLFGSVTTAAIADAVKAAGKGDVDRRSIIGAGDIRALGTYPIQIRLHEDVLAEVKLSVIPAAKK